MVTHDMLCEALEKFIKSRPGFDPADYAPYWKELAADRREAVKARHAALNALNAMRWSAFPTDEVRQDVLDFCNDRLIVKFDGDTIHFEYVAGQYYPTEFRWGAERWINRYTSYSRRHADGIA